MRSGENKAQNSNYFFSSMNGTRPNYYDILKVVAILLMIIDHVGYFFFPQYLFLRVVGRISMPLFLFLVGYNRSGSVSWSLWGGALLADLAFFTYNSMGGLFQYTVSILGSIIIVKLLARAIQYYCVSDTALVFGAIPVIRFLYALSPFLYDYIDYGGLALLIGMSGLVFSRLHTTSYKFFSYLLVIAVLILYLYQQVDVFHIAGSYLLLLIVLCIGFLLAVFALPVARVSLPITMFSKLVLATSRYSLWIYVIHIVIFALISYLVYI